METTIYRHISFEYEAIEISVLLAAKSNGTMDQAPKWVRDAIFEGKVGFPVTAYCLQLKVFPAVLQLGAARDYLMRGPKGQLNLCPPETLAEMYEKVDPVIDAVIVNEKCPECTSTLPHHSVDCSAGDE